VEGVEGAELGDGPAVFAVPELLALPEDETGFFLFFDAWTIVIVKVINLKQLKMVVSIIFNKR
jgi:hypothetical protein